MPGVSPNPGGRPAALADVRDLAREHTPAAVAKLASIMENGKSEMAQIAAATALLDRAWGKATQPIAGDDSMPPVGVSVEDREREIAAKVERAREILKKTFGAVASGADLEH
jgi:hypothetical protein